MRFLILATAMVFIAAPAYAGSDSNMSCEEISAELAKLNEISTAAGGAETSRQVTSAAGAAATQTAIFAGAGSSIPFIGGLSNIASAAANAHADNAKRQAEEADKRIIRLQAIADVKGCQ